MNNKRKITLFCIGFGTVLLSLLISVGETWATFIHMWKAELTASIFLLGCLFYIGYVSFSEKLTSGISLAEARTFLLPILLIIVWSGVSASWADSWRSAIHHTSLWLLYLAFYAVVRSVLDLRGGYNRIVVTISIVIVLLGFPAISQYISLQIFGGSNVLGVTHAKYGEIVVTVLPLLIVWTLRAKGPKYLFGAVAIVCSWMLVICGLGRINLALFCIAAVATLALPFLVGRFSGYRRNAVTIALLLLIAPVPLHSFSLLAERPEAPVVARLTNSEGTSSSNGFRKLMLGISFTMIERNPFLGAGADNFGFLVDEYREIYASERPNDPNLAHAEDTIPERAHNEYVQFVAELGVVGGVLLAWFLLGVLVLWVCALRRFHEIPITSLAAVVGLAAFLTSSLVSSYSFRMVQSGLVFFFVLAVASRGILKDRNEKVAGDRSLSVPQQRAIIAAGILGCVLLAAYSAVRVCSVAFTSKGNHTADLGEARKIYETAMKLDEENPDAPFSLAIRLFNERNFAESAQHMRRAIDIGAGRSVNFSYLASAQYLAGDKAGAQSTMEAAARLYPRSTFVLARYAALLSENGDEMRAAATMEQARRVDERAANSWFLLATQGPTAVSKAAFRDPKYAEVMDLQPIIAVYAVVAEREIRFPGEKRNIPF